MDRRLAAIFVADVVGYSRLMEQDELGTLHALTERYKQTIEPLVREHSGRVVKEMGDGFLIEFASAVNAVACAMTLQERMAEANGKLPEERRIVLRIGINLCDLIGEGLDVFGDGVNIAARLEALANPGSICVSAIVHDAVRGRLDYKAHDLGEIEFKNISRPVRAWSISRGSPSIHAQEHSKENAVSIAVLPFDNMSGIPEQEYISDGISENIITDLSRFRDITVMARNSTFAYKGRPTRVQDICRELSVAFVLEGSVQRAGDRIRVTAQLIEGGSGKHVWVQRYDRQVDDLFAVMDNVTEVVVGTLATTYGGRLRKAVGERLVGSGPTKFQAFDHFLKGMEELNGFTKEGVARSIVHFGEAIAINPRYAKAHAKLAWAHVVDLYFGWSTDVAGSWAKAREAAQAAVRSDDAEAWGHWAVAGCALYGGQHERAMAGMTRAVELNPGDADILTDMGLFSAYCGRAVEGLEFALKAMRINPHYPDYYAAQLGQIYFDGRQYEDAVRTLEGVRTMDTPLMQVYLAASLAALGRQEEAKATVTRLHGIEPASSVAYWTGPTTAPYRDQRDREHLAHSLRNAGLPE